MQLFISADIEGVAGVVTAEQTRPDGFEYRRACGWMTAEVVAACRGALAAGFEKIVVADAHGNGQNLLLNDLPDEVEVVRSWPRPWGMMQGIESGPFDAAMLIGHHGGAHHFPAVLSHSFSSRLLVELRANGQTASETTINAAIAAHFGVPVVLISGDDVLARHVGEILPDTETVVAKRSLGFTSARTRLPKSVQQEIETKSARVLERVSRGSSFRPAPLSLPIILEIDFQRQELAELLSYLPGLSRPRATTVRFQADDIESVSRLIGFLTGVGSVAG